MKNAENFPEARLMRLEADLKEAADSLKLFRKTHTKSENNRLGKRPIFDCTMADEIHLDQARALLAGVRGIIDDLG